MNRVDPFDKNEIKLNIAKLQWWTQKFLEWNVKSTDPMASSQNLLGNHKYAKIGLFFVSIYDQDRDRIVKIGMIIKDKNLIDLELLCLSFDTRKKILEDTSYFRVAV